MKGLKKIHHVAIICSDYEVSKDFYVNKLGFTILKETFRPDTNSYKLDLIISPGHQIELFSFPDPPERLSNPEARGLRHLAFETGDIEATISDLDSKGIEVEPLRIDGITRSKFAFFYDPDKLPLELYEIKP